MPLDDSSLDQLPVLTTISELRRQIVDARIAQLNQELSREGNEGLALAHKLSRRSTADIAEQVFNDPWTMIGAILAFLQEKFPNG